MDGEPGAPAVEPRHVTIHGAKRGTSMNSWSETKSLIVIMAVIAVFYVLGRFVANALGVSV
jgi:hypothetical protein